MRWARIAPPSFKTPAGESAYRRTGGLPRQPRHHRLPVRRTGRPVGGDTGGSRPVHRLRLHLVNRTRSPPATRRSLAGPDPVPVGAALSGTSDIFTARISAGQGVDANSQGCPLNFFRYPQFRVVDPPFMHSDTHRTASVGLRATCRMPGRRDPGRHRSGGPLPIRVDTGPSQPIEWAAVIATTSTRQRCVAAIIIIQ